MLSGGSPPLFYLFPKYLILPRIIYFLLNFGKWISLLVTKKNLYFCQSWRKCEFRENRIISRKEKKIANNVKLFHTKIANFSNNSGKKALVLSNDQRKIVNFTKHSLKKFSKFNRSQMSSIDHEIRKLFAS